MSDPRDASESGKPMVGSYANFFKVGHNAFEFLLDFGQCYPEREGARIHTRIITGPTYAKALLHTLQAALLQYEQAYGAIDE
jgi:hypothetical protein